MKEKIIFRKIIIFSLLFLFYGNTLSVCGTGELLVGVSKVDITPKTSIHMAGYGGRSVPSQGIQDPLYV
ncbi:hypothetical protein KAS50_01865, partial [bacterium]|nr:hypothetical protein [bacterium]